MCVAVVGCVDGLHAVDGARLRRRLRLAPFAGLLLFSILTGLLIQLISIRSDFEAMCSEYLENCNKWIMKLERANDHKGETFMPPQMYRTIISFTEAAFRHDHNLIIEEANFYYQLKPQD